MMRPSFYFVQLLFICIFVGLCTSSSTQIEAETSHISGVASISKATSGYSGTGYALLSPYQNNNGQGRVILTYFVPSDASYSVSIRYIATSTTPIGVHVNGFIYADQSLTAASSWATISISLWLRAGLNTVHLINNQYSTIGIDYVTVIGTSSTNSNGATLPYFSMEAEAAARGGAANVLAPSTTYMTLASEASGRQAVQLSSANDYVEFTLTGSTNAFSVRFSIPDSSSGSGLTGSLGVYIGGSFSFNLALSSQYSWTYGTYPYTNIPSQGRPHHFFDEVRHTFPTTLAAGTKVRLAAVPTGGVVYTIDLVDFYTVPAPYAQPAGSVSVTSYGADRTGVSDSTSAFSSAINAAGNGGVVWIPQGTFLVSSAFWINYLTIRGAGPWYSTVKTNTAGSVGFSGWGSDNPSRNTKLLDFAISGATTYRIESSSDSASGGAMTTGCLIQNIYIEHTKVGMWFVGPMTGLHVTGVIIRNTWADGINMNTGVTNTWIAHSSIRNTGDDAIALWSSGIADSNNVVSFNTIQLPCLANGIAIYGGTSNTVSDNYVADIVNEGGGLNVANRFTATAFSGVTALTRNTLIRASSPTSDNSMYIGAIWVYAADAAIATGTIAFSGTSISGSAWAAVSFWGGQIGGSITFDTMTVSGGKYVVDVLNGVTGAATFTNTVATGISVAGVHICSSSFIVVENTSGNTGWVNSYSC